MVGNLNELNRKNAAIFVNANEKTVRQVFEFHRSLSSVIAISLDQVDYPSKSCRQFLRGLTTKNQYRLIELLRTVDLYNIRLLSESFQLFTYAYRNHAGFFRTHSQLSFTWYLALLAVLVLVKRRLISEEQQALLFQNNHSSNHGFEFLSSIGYFSKSDSENPGPTTRCLLDTIFYRLDKINLKGIFSLVSHGYYIAEDFQEDFTNWTDEENIQTYLDREAFYSLDNGSAQALFSGVYRALITDMRVRNPLTILFLAERVVEDIANGITDVNPVTFKREIIEVADRLFQSGQMESVSIDVFDIAGDRFVNCRAIYRYVTEKNQQYLEAPSDLTSNLEKNRPEQVLSETVSSQQVLKTLEPLENSQLREVAEWLDQTGMSDAKKLINAQPVIFEALTSLRATYTNAIGIRANHFRTIANALYRLNELADDTLPPQVISGVTDQPVSS